MVYEYFVTMSIESEEKIEKENLNFLLADLAIDGKYKAETRIIATK